MAGRVSLGPAHQRRQHQTSPFQSIPQRPPQPPVPVQPVRYADIASMERVLSGGLSAGKVAAIAAGTGAAAFFGILFAFMAAYSD